MSDFQLFVGTVYGSSVELAQECQAFLDSLGHTTTLYLSPELPDLDSTKPLLLFSATTGMGDIPDNLMPFYCDLLDDQPDLSSLKFAVVGLGDSSYDYFNGAARRLNELLLELGARPCVDPLWVDASQDPDPADPVMSWLARWVD